jgi:hypothetical protein
MRMGQGSVLATHEGKIGYAEKRQEFKTYFNFCELRKLIETNGNTKQWVKNMRLLS